MGDTSPSLKFFSNVPLTPGHGVQNSMNDGSLLQTLVLGVVLGNISTLIIVLVMYFNIVLFGHYGSELMYAVLLSEALFTTKKALLNSVKRYTSEPWSPRSAILNSFTSFRGLFAWTSFLGVLLQLAPSSDVAMMAFAIIILSFILLDRYMLFIFRLHHFFVSDEALISVILVFVLVACLGVFMGSFLVLALRDAAVVLDACAAYMNEHFVKDPLVREKFNEALEIGKGQIDSVSKSLQEQYQGTPYGPAVVLTTNLLSNVTKRFESSGEPFAWSISDWEPLRDEVLSVGMSAFYNGTLSLKDAFRNAADGIYLSVAVLTSILFACIDFGFRAAFFTGVLLFFVSNPKSVLETVMESILSIFAKAQRSNSLSSMVSETNGVENDVSFEAEDRERAHHAHKFEDDLRFTITAVVAVPLTLAGANAIASLIIISVLNLFGANITGPFFAALISLLLTLVPIVSPFLSCAPWSIVGFIHGRHWAGIALIVAQYVVFNMLDGYVLSSFHNGKNQRNQESFRTYLTGLSFFFGISSMGLHGIILGPLFVSFFYTVCSTLLAFARSRDSHMYISTNITRPDRDHRLSQ